MWADHLVNNGVMYREHVYSDLPKFRIQILATRSLLLPPNLSRSGKIPIHNRYSIENKDNVWNSSTKLIELEELENRDGNTSYLPGLGSRS